jgi:hypothetical protein
LRSKRSTERFRGIPQTTIEVFIMARALIEGNKTILGAILRIQTAGKELDDEIQLVGLSCMQHIEVHGDITLACTLYLAMPQGARKAALSAWLMTFGKLEANTGKNKKEQPFTYKRDAVTNLDGAEASPWYTFKLDKTPDAVFNLTESIQRLLQRVDAAVQKGVAIEGIAAVDALRALVPAK